MDVQEAAERAASRMGFLGRTATPDEWKRARELWVGLMLYEFAPLAAENAELKRWKDAEIAALKLIVRERTHREKGCLCERCVEDEHHEATVISDLRRDADRYRVIRDELAFGQAPGFADGLWCWRVHDLDGRHKTFDAAVDAALAQKSQVQQSVE